jgi:hypothetical protein
MPIRAQALTMHYFATDADGPKTGDVGNHALRIIEDGVIGTIAASPAEIDATNAPGMYKVAITAAENTADVVTLCGKSSSSGVTISPSTWTNITNADAAATTASSLGASNSTKLGVIDGIVDSILVDTGTTLDGKLDTIDGIVDAILVDTAVLGASPIAANIMQIAGGTDAVSSLKKGSASILEGSVTSGCTTTSIVGTGSLSTVDEFYTDRMILFTSGDLEYSGRAIAAYTGSTKTFTVSPAFTSSASSSDTFIIV